MQNLLIFNQPSKIDFNFFQEFVKNLLYSSFICFTSKLFGLTYLTTIKISTLFLFIKLIF